MRDIRSDLKDRINGAERDIKELKRALDEAYGRHKSYSFLLDQEERLWSGSPSLSEASIPGNGKDSEDSPLTRLLMGALTDGNAWHASQLIEYLHESKYPFGDKSPARVVHFALVGLNKAERIRPGKEKGWWHIT